MFNTDRKKDKCKKNLEKSEDDTHLDETFHLSETFYDEEDDDEEIICFESSVFVIPDCIPLGGAADDSESATDCADKIHGKSSSFVTRRRASVIRRRRALYCLLTATFIILFLGIKAFVICFILNPNGSPPIQLALGIGSNDDSSTPPSAPESAESKKKRAPFRSGEVVLGSGSKP